MLRILVVELLNVFENPLIRIHNCIPIVWDLSLSIPKHVKNDPKKEATIHPPLHLSMDQTELISRQRMWHYFLHRSLAR